MGKRLIKKRQPLTRNQQTIFHYFKEKKKPKIRRKPRAKKIPKEDDSSYRLSSKTDETDDFDKLDLEDETIESQHGSPVIDLTEEEKPEEKRIKKYPKIKRIRTRKSIKNSLGRKTISIKRKRKRRRKTKKEKDENMNSFAELNHCYNKLSDLISEYNFSDIADVILKLNNDIKKDQFDKNEKALFKEFKKINSVIKKKDDIIMMCLSILNSRNNINENNKGINAQDESKEKDSIIQEKCKKKTEREKNEPRFIDGLKGMHHSDFTYGLHFFNSKNGVYIYDPREGKNRESLTLYCKKYTSGCRAKCVIYNNSNDVTMKGSHNHIGTSYKYFCNIHPEFKNKTWEHAQIIKENGRDIIIKQC